MTLKVVQPNTKWGGQKGKGGCSRQQLERGGTTQPAPGPVQDSGAGAFPENQELGTCPCVQGELGLQASRALLCREADSVSLVQAPPVSKALLPGEQGYLGDGKQAKLSRARQR